jgi:hypothetical protein
MTIFSAISYHTALVATRISAITTFCGSRQAASGYPA